MLKFIEKEGSIYKYENEQYKVFFDTNSETGVDVKIISKEFKSPRIEEFSGKLEVNIAATGSLSKDELLNHMKVLDVAMKTIEQIELTKETIMEFEKLIIKKK